MNLTQDLGVISPERPDYGAKPGHDLVVFEVTKNGHRFAAHVPHGEEFIPRRTFPRLIFVSFAVNRNADLRHSFTKRFNHMTASHAFDLTFTLAYSVDRPVELVNRRLDDPLQRVCNEVARTLGGEICSEPWTEVLESKRQNNLSILWQRVWTRREQRLKDFARNYGIDLQTVDAALGLNQEDEEPSVVAENLARKRVIEQSKEQSEQLDRIRKTQSEIAGISSGKLVDAAEHERRRQRELHAIDEAGLKARTTIIEGTTSTMMQTLGQVGSQIHSMDEFKRALQLSHGMVQSMLSAGGTAAHEGNGSQSATPLLQSSQTTSEVVKLLTTIVERYGAFAEARGAQRKFFAAALHWVAELSLGDDADEMLLKQYGATLRNFPDDLEDEQYLLLQRLLNEEEIRALLS